MTILDRNSGSFNTTTGVTVTRSAGSYGTGTVIVVAIVGNTVFNTPGSATQRTSSVVNLGLYSYDIAGAGQSSIAFTATAAGSGEWYAWELSAGSTWLTGTAGQDNIGAGGYTPAAVTPTAGGRHLLVAAGGAGSGSVRSVISWSNSFTQFAGAQVSAQDWPFSAGADLDVTADGVTSYTSLASFSGFSQAASGGVLLAYVNASGSIAPPPLQPVRRRAISVPRASRTRASTPVPPQVNTLPLAGAKQSRRLRGLLGRRGKSFLPVPPQVVVVPPAIVLRPVRARLMGLRLFRGRSASPVTAQVVLVAPPYVPAGVRARLKWPRWIRSRAAVPPAAQVPPLAAPHVRPRVPVPRRAHITGPPMPQATVQAAPAYPPGLTRAARHLARLFRGAARFVPFASTAPPVVLPRTPTVTVDLGRAVAAADMSRVTATADLTRPSVTVAL